MPNSTSELQIGQVWRDWDSRQRNDFPLPRMLKIVEFTETHARCEVGTLVGDQFRQTGGHTKIRKDRFKPTSTGYKLVKDPT